MPLTRISPNYQTTIARRRMNALLDDHGVKQKDVASWIDCTQQNVSSKLKRMSFSMDEIATIFDRTGATDEEIIKIMRRA